MYAIVVDYYQWDEKNQNEYTIPVYLGIAYPPKNLYVFDEEHNSRSFRWEDKAEAEKYLCKFKINTKNSCSFTNARVEEVKVCTK